MDRPLLRLYWQVVFVVPGHQLEVPLAQKEAANALRVQVAAVDCCFQLEEQDSFRIGLHEGCSLYQLSSPTLIVSVE